jgi:hypothetical protein
MKKQCTMVWTCVSCCFLIVLFENRYGFKMVESLGNTSKVFDGHVVYVAPIPNGAKIPPLSELKLIVEFAGEQEEEGFVFVCFSLRYDMNDHNTSTLDLG